MSKHKRERSPLYPKILFGFTEHPITGVGWSDFVAVVF